MKTIITCILFFAAIILAVEAIAPPTNLRKLASIDVCCWTPATTDGYLIYYRTENGQYGNPLDAGSVGHFPIHNLMVGKKYYAVGKVYRLNNRNVQSLLSNEVYFIAQ
jgi:hypothetical protein